MQYLGGKSRLAKPISKIINENRKDGQMFISLFVGAGSVEQYIEEPKILNDKHYYLIELYKALQNKEIELPEYVSEEEYKYIKTHLDENPAIAGFVGFACSYGGQWFGWYARNRKGDNYTKRGKKSLEVKIENGLLKGAMLSCEDYTYFKEEKDCIIYADPPYLNTQGYKLTGKFNHDEFWNNMREMSRNNLIFISESECPKDFKIVFKKLNTITVDIEHKNKSDKNY